MHHPPPSLVLGSPCVIPPPPRVPFCSPSLHDSLALRVPSVPPLNPPSLLPPFSPPRHPSAVPPLLPVPLTPPQPPQQRHPPVPPSPPPICAVPPQHQAADVVTVSSVFQQRYECRLPPAALRRPPDPPPESRPYNGSGVAELLRPMAAAPCLLKVGENREGLGGGWRGAGGRGGAWHAAPPPWCPPSPPQPFPLLQTKDWWTYRFCYEKHIQQYHVEGACDPPQILQIQGVCGCDPRRGGPGLSSSPPSILPDSCVCVCPPPTWGRPPSLSSPPIDEVCSLLPPR